MTNNIFWLCDIVLGDFSHMLLMLHAMIRMLMGHYVGIPTSRVTVFWVDICTFPTANSVVTNKINCYNCVVQHHSLLSFTEMNGQGYNSVAQ